LAGRDPEALNFAKQVFKMARLLPKKTRPWSPDIIDSMIGAAKGDHDCLAAMTRNSLALTVAEIVTRATARKGGDAAVADFFAAVAQHIRAGNHRKSMADTARFYLKNLKPSNPPETAADIAAEIRFRTGESVSERWVLRELGELGRPKRKPGQH